jgi:2-polyprenyl-3-methyl-5-hydroxy-6-metoxy-1,4-benzoquinol methylase
MQPDLISENYLREQKKLHAAPRGYGGGGHKWADLVHTLAGEFGCYDAILDYGAGQGTLGAELARRGLKARNYDPAVFKFALPPARSDFVVCTDVLEHIEPDRLDAVIAHLKSLTARALFAVVSVVPTEKTLSDGRQAHICLHDRAWWLAKLGASFDLVRTFEDYRPDKQVVAVFTARAVS